MQNTASHKDGCCGLSNMTMVFAFAYAYAGIMKHQAQILDMRESPKHPEPPKFSEFKKTPPKNLS